MFPIVEAFKQKSISPLINPQRIMRDVSKSISDPTNYMGAGATTKASKELHAMMENEASIKSFGNDIAERMKQMAMERKQAMLERQAQEQRKNYWMSTTPEQRFLDKIKNYRK